MKDMRILTTITATLLALIFSTSCTKYNLVDTGVAHGDHDMVMWDYFKHDPYNWDSVMVMIDHAGLKGIFDGTDARGKAITFLGYTNHSIRRYLLANQIATVKDIPAEECREIILSGVIGERLLLDEVPEGRMSQDPDVLIGSGGKVYDTLSGKKLWIYTARDPFGGVPNSGVKVMRITALDTQKRFRVVSTDIKTRNGVVQALDYNFTIKDI